MLGYALIGFGALLATMAGIYTVEAWKRLGQLVDRDD